MNTIFNIRTLIIVLIGFVILQTSLTSCKKIKNPRSGKDIKDTISYELQKTRVFVQFIDVLTNQNITSDDYPFSVEVVGKSKEFITDVVGIQHDTYFPKNGFLTLALLPEVIPSNSSPINFTIVSNLQNYKQGYKEICITNDGEYFVKISMVNILESPEGIIVEELLNVGNLYNGVLFDDITVSTPDNEASVTIKAGTKLMTSDSNNLAGKLNLSLLYYNTHNDDALSTIPGGIVSSLLKNNTIGNMVFFPAGIFCLKITDSDHREAHYIHDKMLEISINLSSNSYNPNTWTNYKDGDEVELLIFNADSGLWVYDRNTTITTIAGNLNVTTQTSRLNSYSFSNYHVNSCNEGSSFITSGDCQQCGSLFLEGILRKQIDNSYISNISLTAEWGKNAHLPFTTSNTETYIDWNEVGNCNTCVVSPSVSPMQIANMCSQQSIDLPITNTGPVTISIIANFEGQCPVDTNYVILPSFGVWTKHIDSECWRWNKMEKGIAKICNLEYGETYVFGTYYNNTWQEWEAIVDKEIGYRFTVDFTDEICTDVLGIL